MLHPFVGPKTGMIPGIQATSRRDLTHENSRNWKKRQMALKKGCRKKKDHVDKFLGIIK